MTPIFIGGCGRSGTTLLGAMLGSHRDCLTIPESQFLIDVFVSGQPQMFQDNLRNFNTPRNMLSCEPDSAGCVKLVDVEAAWKAIRGHWRFKLWELGATHLPSKPPQTYPALIEWLVGKYGEAVCKSDVNYWIDHTGQNTEYAATLLEWFPSAKFIHIVRDGRGVAASVMSRDWGPNTIIEAARWWVRSLAFGLAAEQFFGPQRILRVRYEDLIRQAEVIMRQVSHFLELEYTPEMLTGRGFRVPAYTQEQHELIGKHLDASRIDSWKTSLSPRQIEIFESCTGDLLRLLGYDLHCFPARSPTTREEWTLRLQEFCCWIVNSLRWRRRIRKHLR